MTSLADRLWADLRADVEEGRCFGRDYQGHPYEPRRCALCGWPFTAIPGVTLCPVCRRRIG